MVLTGFIMFVLASVGLLIVYKGKQRVTWISGFLAALLAHIAALYIRTVTSPEHVTESVGGVTLSSRKLGHS